MTEPSITSDRLIHLDMLRGVAALLVCVGHLRGFLFAPYGTIESPSLAITLFYFVTSLGHQAVIVFFALSGYLVGGQAMRQILTGIWKFQSYMIRRLSRLWVVAVPAIALTWFWDTVGSSSYLPEFYEGAFYSTLASGPSAGNIVDHSLSSLLGNIFFLQTIATPIFGNNGPMWSLANEFWYYMIFPLAFLACAGKLATSLRLLLFLLVVSAAILLPFQLIVLGTIWVLGSASTIATKTVGKFRSGVKITLAILSLAGLALSAAASLHYGVLAADLVLGFFCAGALPILAAMPPLGHLYGRLAAGLSEISYTLYVVHFPFITAIVLMFEIPLKLPVGVETLVTLFAILFVTLAYAVVVWWLFERNTTTIRRWLESTLHSSTGSVPHRKIN